MLARCVIRWTDIIIISQSTTMFILLSFTFNSKLTVNFTSWSATIWLYSHMHMQSAKVIFGCSSYFTASIHCGICFMLNCFFCFSTYLPEMLDCSVTLKSRLLLLLLLLLLPPPPPLLLLLLLLLPSHHYCYYYYYYYYYHHHPPPPPDKCCMVDQVKLLT